MPRLLWLLLIVALNLARPTPSYARFDPRLFEVDRVRVVVGIDLSDESSISAGFVIKDVPSRNPTLARVVLPFTTTKAEPNAQILATWGSYNDSTLLALALPGTGAYYSVELTPNVRRNEGQDPLGSGPSITLLQDGQLRTFIYRYPAIKPVESSLMALFRSGSLPLDAVAVRLPEGAKPLGVRSGKTSDPPEIFNLNHIGFYPAARQGGSDQLELRYLVPATEGQKALAEILTKLFAVIAAPFVTGLVTKVTDKAAKRRRKTVIIVGLVIQALVLLGIGTLWFEWSGATSASNLIDLGIGVLGSLGCVVIWWIG